MNKAIFKKIRSLLTIVMLVAGCLIYHSITYAQNVYVVTSTENAGPGTLRTAFSLANNSPGHDTIRFNIPETDTNRFYYSNNGINDDLSPFSIARATVPDAQINDFDFDYPVLGFSWYKITLSGQITISDAVYIDGFSQPGAVEGDLKNGVGHEMRIQVTSGAGANVIWFNSNGANGSTIKGLTLSQGAILLRMSIIQRMNVLSNYIGTNPLGLVENGGIVAGISLQSARHSVIENNLISGNEKGIEAAGSFSSNFRFNFIGTNYRGDEQLRNFNDGLEASRYDSIVLNLISGNSGFGVDIEDADFVHVEANHIGTDMIGSNPIQNALSGINVLHSSQIEIRDNLLSGNNAQGINIDTSDNIEIYGNKIGTDFLGTDEILNVFEGIRVAFSNDIIIGGDHRNAPFSDDRCMGNCNLISGNSDHGIELTDCSNVVVSGNLIGTNIAAVATIPNRSGVQIDGRAANIEVLGNVISGNVAGIAIAGSGVASSGTLIKYNLIGEGLHSAGLHNLGNNIDINNSFLNVIEENTIANAQNAIVIGDFSAGNAIRSNSIYNHDFFSIDLLGQVGHDANDPLDADGGGNALLNHPEIDTAYIDGTQFFVSGRLEALPSTAYEVEFFHNRRAHSSGFGEGELYLDVIAVNTDGSGSATFTHSMNLNFPGDDAYITATATDLVNLNTSEFSAAYFMDVPTDTVCLEFVDTFSIDTIGGTIAYTWTVPAGATIVSGQGSNFIIVDWVGASIGVDSVCVTAEDTCATSTATCRVVYINICNTGPIANMDTACIDEDSISIIDVLQNDFDAQGRVDTTSLTVVIDPVNGTADEGAGVVIYTPNPDFYGEDSLSYSVCDNFGLCDTAWVFITVKPVNDAPIAETDNFSASTDSTEIFDVLNNDSDIDGQIDQTTVVVVNQPLHGTASADPVTGEITYTSDSAFSGIDTFAYAVCDDGVPSPVLCDTALVIVLVDDPCINFSVTVTKQNPTTNNGAEGEAVATADGGNPPYTFVWSNGVTTSVNSGLTEGVYTVTVTDRLGCTGTGSAVLVDPVCDLDITGFDINHVNCNAGSDGAVAALDTTGNPPVTYLWSNGETSQTISGLSSGVYTVTLSDNINCTASRSTTINQPSALAITIDQRNVSAINGNDGWAAALVSGGTPPYTYLWNDQNASTTDTAFNLSSGQYSVEVTDSNGCMISGTVTISEPGCNNLAVNVIGNHVTCFGADNGSASAVVSGGTSPFLYSWSNGQTSSTAVGLSPGSYDITVEDSVSCLVISSIVISEPAELTTGLVPTDVTCNQFADGTLELSVSGGTAGYTYNWSNGATTEDQAGLGPDTYCVTVTDANNCQDTICATIIQPVALFLFDDPAGVSCFGGSDGSIDLSVSGGTMPYSSYDWSNGASTEDVEDLMAGDYTVIVVDRNGCRDTLTSTIIQPDVIALSASTTDAGSVGASDGAVDVSVTGGTNPYRFAWSNGPTTEDISGLEAGTYCVTITDNNDCVDSLCAVVSEPGCDSVSIDNVVTAQVSCNGFNDGQIDIFASSTVPLSYSIDGGQSYQPLPSFTSLAPGNYNIAIRDSLNCSVAASISTTISEPDSLTLNLFADSVQCNGDSTGAVQSLTAGGTAPYSYDWSNGHTGQNLIDVATGNYCVTITDQNGCSVSDCIFVDEPVEITIDIVTDSVLCFEGTDGQASATVIGGTGAYTYLWGNGETSPTVAQLTAGTYCLTVSDENNCIAISCDTVFEPEPLDAILSDDSVRCSGGSTGSITNMPEGGVTPYTYLWSNGATTQDLNDVSAGIYCLTMTDANGCTVEVCDTIYEYDMLIASTDVTHLSCYDDRSGAIDLTVLGGNGPFNYLWSHVSIQEDVSNLRAGVYCVTVVDQNSCFVINCDTITEPDPLSVSSQVTQVGTVGGTEGAIDLIVTGGTEPFDFNWSNGATTEDLTDLSSGAYCVTITDANGCIDSLCAFLNEPGCDSLILDTVTFTDISCNGADDASITVFATGPYPIEYSINTGGTFQSSNQFENLAPANYQVVIRDSVRCVATASFSIDITEPPALQIFTVADSVLCNGGSSGSIDLLLGGGTLPFQFAWTNGSNAPNLSDLTAGIYCVTVTDANGCSESTCDTIYQPSLLTLSATQDSVRCNGGSSGEVNLTVSGGSGNYSFIWSNGSQSEDLTNVAAGTYCVTVTDGNSCVDSLCIDVLEPSLLVLTGSASPAGCNGEASGTASVQATGGTTAYSYLWNNGETSASINDLSAGTYCVTVTDANGCSASICGDVTEPDLLIVTVDTDSVDCNSDADGCVTAQISGGTAPFVYSWFDGSGDPQVCGLSAGNYCITVTDGNGCTASVCGNVGEPAALILATAGTNPTSVGSADGSVSVNASGGIAPYSYQWNDPNLQTTATATGLESGTYCVTVTDANNCIETACVQIEDPACDSLRLNALVADALCFGDSSGQAFALPEGGQTPYGFAWSNGEITQGIIDLPAGTYAITVTDAVACSASNTVTVEEPTELMLTLQESDISCNGSCDGSINLNILGGTGPYTHVWSNGAITEDLSNLCNGNYCVTVTDANGCEQQICGSVSEPDVLTANIAHTDVSALGASDGTATANPQGGTAPFSYLWNDQIGQQTQTAIGLEPGIYCVEIIDVNGCEFNGCVIINDPNCSSLATTASVEDVTCFNGSNGITTAFPTGGTPPYSFLWSDGQLTQSASQLSPGVYTVTVTDSLGCQALTTAVVDQPDEVVLNLVTKESDCNDSTGIATAVVLGGIQPINGYDYLWSDGSTDQINSGLSPGSYCVTATDFNGCTVADCRFVGQIDTFEAPGPITGPAQVCPNSLATYSVPLVAGATSYIWTGPADASLFPQGNNSVFVQWGNTPGNICVSAVNPCDTSVPFCLSVILDSTFSISLISPDDTICNGETVGIFASGGPGDSYFWTPPNGLDDVNAQTPQANPTQTTTYTVVAIDDQSGCVSLPASVTVTVNQGPDAVNDQVSGTEDVTTTIDPLANDTDPENDSLVITLVGQPPHGTASTFFGEIVYTPNADYNGQDTITYRACNYNCPDLCDEAFIFVSIDSVNDNPTAVTDFVNTPEETLVCIDVLANDFDIDGDDITMTVLTTTSNGVIFMLPGDTCITYVPNTDFNGTDTFTYQICDDGNPQLCDTGIVIINVLPVNDGPTIVDSNGTKIDFVCFRIPEDSLFSFCYGVDDVDGPGLDATILYPASNGQFTILNDTCFSYMPDQDFNGTDTMAVVVCDNGTPEVCDTLIVKLIVEPINDQPTAVRDKDSTNKNTTLIIDAIDNDFDIEGDSIFITRILSGPSNGSATNNGDGTITYVPDSGFVGIDTLFYVLCDFAVNSLCDTGMVIICVGPGPQIIAVTDSVRVDRNGTKEIKVLANDIFDQADDTTVIIVIGPQNGSASVNADGSISYVPDLNFKGLDSLLYELCVIVNNVRFCDTAWVIIRIGDLPTGEIPNAFSPNGDGVNDLFYIDGLSEFYPFAKISFFNRWGDEVWRSNGIYQNDWAGTTQDGKPLPDGTYYFVFDYNDGVREPFASFVVINR